MNSDIPRVAQWLDEDQLDEEQPGHDIQTDLAGISLGSLRTARATLAEQEDDSDDDDETSESDDSESGNDEAPSLPTCSKTLIQKRSSKHAPTEVSSKRPVTRRRLVVDRIRQEARDPRFLPLAGEFDRTKYRANYNFLSDTHQGELKTLRENLSRTKKSLSSVPKSDRQEREDLIRKLELAAKRAESAVNQDKREKLEHVALEKVAHDEKAKRKAGKAGWWMKDSEKKQVVARARFEQLQTEGGSRAVKKAIAKKQKKIAQQEKKSRPFAKGKRPRDVDESEHGPRLKRAKR